MLWDFGASKPLLNSNGSSEESKLLPQSIDQISLGGKMQTIVPGQENNKCRGHGMHLSNITDPQLLMRIPGCELFRQVRHKHMVQRSRGNSDPASPVSVAYQLEQF